MGTSRRPHRARIRRGDLVKVVTGADRGRTGRVLRVIPDRGMVVVEGVNLVHRHIRRSQKNPQGGRVRREAAVNLSNVMLMDPVQEVPTRVGRRCVDPEKGARGFERFARKSKEAIQAGAGKSAKKARKSKE